MMNQEVQTDKPRVVLVGLGGYAKRHLEMLTTFGDDFELVGVVVLPSELALPEVAQLQSNGVEVISDFNQLGSAFGGRMDLCVIPTGIHLHAAMAIEALHCGANVLLEKPLAGSVEDGIRIMQAEKATRRWVALGFQDIYAEDVQCLKHQLLAGDIGPIREIRLLALGARADRYFKRNRWAGRLTCDGVAVNDSPLNNAFAHLVNLCLYLAGSTESESAGFTAQSGSLYRARDIESFDTAVVSAQSANGVKLWVGSSHACRVSDETRLIIEGEQGRVEWVRGRHYEVFSNDREAYQKILADNKTVREQMYKAILQRLRGQSGGICSTKVGMCHLSYIESIHRSFPILDVPLNQIRTIPIGDDPENVGQAIENIEGLMRNAFDQRNDLRLEHTSEPTTNYSLNEH